MRSALIRPVFFALALTALPAWADEITATSAISKVTVYSDRASVTRTLTTDIPAGDHVIVLSNLPAGLFPDSLRAEGKSNTTLSIGAVESKMTAQAELSAPRERELQDKLQDLQDQRDLMDAEKKALIARQAFLAKIGDTAAARVNEDIKNTLTLKAEEWVAASDKVAQAMRDDAKTMQTYTIGLRKLDDQIAALEEEIDQIQTGANQTYTIRIPVKVQAAGALSLDLQYQIGNASWQPLYDARLNSKTSQIALLQYGEVHQATGEDWSNVTLTLSTAQPARGATPPDLQTNWVSLLEAVAQRMNKATFGFAGEAAMDSMAAGAPAAAPLAMARAPEPILEKAVQFQAAQIETGGYVAQYRVPGQVQVLADNSSKKVLIGELKTTAKLAAQVRPALDENAYLVAKVKLEGDAPLLPGMVNLFRDNTFIGTAMQQMLRPAEETDLAFGIDDQVKVKRQILTDKRGKSGLIANYNTADRLTLTEVQNLHSFPITLDVLETIPVSQNEKVKVTINAKDTTPGATDDAQNITGLKKWTFTLAPQAKQAVKLGWSVTWPENTQIVGLP